MSVRKSHVAALLGAALIAASTLLEGSGNFSNNWAAPTLVASGTTSVSGTGAPEWMGSDPLDVFQFTGLILGATSFVFDFSLTGPYSPRLYTNGDGAIYFRYVPFASAFHVDQGNGKDLGSHDLRAGAFDVTYNPWVASTPSRRGNSTFTLNLGDEFAGELFLALDFTYGRRVSYNITSPAWVESSSGNAPSAVPLPAAGWLLLAGLTGLGLAAARRKRG